MNFVRDLITANPMMVEIQRFRQRIFSGRRAGGINRAIVILILVCYAIIVAVLLQNAKDIDPVALIAIQGLIYSILVPVMVSGSIAGERERRTWDILLVAPVTKSQLVAGKTAAALTGVAVFAVAVLIPTSVCALIYPEANLGVAAAAEIYCLGYAALLVAASIYISSRTRTVFAALATSLGVFFVALVVLPGVWGMAVSTLGGRSEDYFNWHPIYVLFRFADHNSSTYPGDHWSLTITTFIAYALTSVLFFAGSVWQVRKLEEISNSPSSEPKEAKKVA